MKKNTPTYFYDVKERIDLLDSNSFCNSSFNVSEGQQDQWTKCNSSLNGLLNLGITKALSYMYRHYQKELVKFEQAKLNRVRDLQFLA